MSLSSSQIAPSILSFPHADLRVPLRAMETSGVGLIHLDVMDGQFVPPITFGDGLARSVHSMINIPMEAHLMTLNPERQVDAFADAGCFRMIFHAEATFHSYRCIQQIHDAGMEAGIAINPGTSLAAIEEVIADANSVLIMTVNPGYGGQKFIPEMVNKIAKLRELNPQVLIEVDGGIDPTTIHIASRAGAQLFVVGSYLQKPATIQEAVNNLVNGSDETEI